MGYRRGGQSKTLRLQQIEERTSQVSFRRHVGNIFSLTILTALTSPI
jgi:hypothetical protein